MKFSTTGILLALSASPCALAEDLLSPGPGIEHCGSFEHDLTLSGDTSAIGEIVITDSLNPWGQVAIDVELNDGFDLTANQEDDSAPTWITKVQVSVCCPAPTTVACVEETIEYAPGVTSATFVVDEPDCGVIFHEHEVLVDVHATVEKMGGEPAIHALFPQRVEYTLVLDYGNNEGASYFDITFRGDSPLQGLSFDGYCVDWGHGISTSGTTRYTGWAHSYQDTAALEGTNIEYPDNMDLVAWAINTYRPGSTFTEVVNGNLQTYTMTSGTLQRAIWYIVGDDNGGSGTYGYDDAWAQHVANEATGHDGYMPGNGGYIPIVLIPDNGNVQHVIIEATCEKLQIPCDPITVTSTADATAKCAPDAPAGMTGDPHLMSFSGEYFEYMGECDLVLLRVPNFGGGKDDLTVHVRTTIRYDYSYIEVAAIRIGEDTLEVTGWGEYSVNDVQDATILTSLKDKTGHEGLLSKIGGYPIFHTLKTDDQHRHHQFDIVLPHHQNITITSLKDIVNVKINHASFEYFGNVEGILGNHHGQMLARDGVTDLSGDINALGQEWQVRDNEPMLFTLDRLPQYPQKCNLPNVAERESRRVGEGISEEQAKVACAHLKANTKRFENCIYDVTITNDLDQASAY